MSDAVDGLIAEADDDAGASFVFGGERFTLPAKLDFRAIVALQRGNFDRALSILLGAEQMERFLDVDTDEVFDESKLNELTDRVMKQSGSSAGESGASTTS